MSQYTVFSDLRVWPEVVLPRMDVLVYKLEPGLTEDGIAYLGTATPSAYQITPLPDEFYAHELRDLDLSSETAIARFASQYGLFRLDGIAFCPTTPEQIEVLLGAIATGTRQEPDAPDLGDDPAVLEARLATGRAHATAGRGVLVSLEEFRLVVRLLRDMVRITQADAGALDFDAVFSEWESPLTWARPKTPEEAVILLADWIEAGLSDVRPSVRHRNGLRLGEPSIGALEGFSAVCVQLFNKIASGSGFKKCANTVCNRIFSRQRSKAGATRPGQWSEEAMGLMYCSPACAQAQASRVRRANIRRAARLEQDGRSVREIAADMEATEQQVARWLAAAAKRRKEPEGNQPASNARISAPTGRRYEGGGSGNNGR